MYHCSKNVSWSHWYQTDNTNGIIFYRKDLFTEKKNQLSSISKPDAYTWFSLLKIVEIPSMKNYLEFF